MAWIAARRPISARSATHGAGGESRFGLQIYGSKGVIEMITGHLPSVQFLPDPLWSPGRSKGGLDAVSSAGIGKPEPLKDGGLGGGNMLAVKDLLSAIENDRQPECNMYEARHDDRNDLLPSSNRTASAGR